MKKIVTLLFISVALFATSMQKVPHSFSKSEKEILLKEFSYPSLLHTSKTYNIKKGWNKLITPVNGVDVVQTFNDTSTIKFVVTYDETSKIWAMFTPNETLKPILFLKYLEPNITFFVLAKDDVSIDIKSSTMSTACTKIMKNEKSDFVTDSGITKAFTINKQQSIALQSRYYSHHEQGIYDDTRVTLIYKKIDSTSKRNFKYGPAKPKIALKYTKEYEGQKFYIYDYKEQGCFIGFFPSVKIPPFPVLKIVD